MNPNRIDTISKLFATRKTRRAAIAGGLATATLGSRVFAQEGTPEVATPAVDPNDPHPSADDAQADPEFLFVQPFDGGTWAPKAGEDGTYTLTLSGAAANTIYFSDRPERIVGLSPTAQFLDGLGFTPENPPNAAAVAPTETGDQDVLVIELLNPQYEADAETLTYDATVLADYGEHGLAHLARRQQDYEFPETFSEGGLFIDGCPDDLGRCYQIVNDEPVVVGPIPIGRCYGGIPICTRCNKDGKSPYYSARCADAYPHQCSPINGLWDCWVDHKCDDIDVEPCS